MAHRRRLVLVGVCLLVAVAFAAIYARIDASHHPGGVGTYQTARLKLGDKTIYMDIADNPDKMHLGLGGRRSLAADRGMIFIYGDSGQRCFWMKDMEFPIDILWLDAQKKVGHIEKSLDPDTYPQSYCPDVATRYVVELQSGVSQAAGIKSGDSLEFEL